MRPQVSEQELAGRLFFMASALGIEQLRPLLALAATTGRTPLRRCHRRPARPRPRSVAVEVLTADRRRRFNRQNVRSQLTRFARLTQLLTKSRWRTVTIASQVEASHRLTSSAAAVRCSLVIRAGRWAGKLGNRLNRKLGRGWLANLPESDTTPNPCQPIPNPRMLPIHESIDIDYHPTQTGPRAQTTNRNPGTAAGSNHRNLCEFCGSGEC